MDLIYGIGNDALTDSLPKLTQYPDCGYPVADVKVVTTKTAAGNEAIFDAFKVKPAAEESSLPSLETYSEDLALLGTSG